MSNPSLRKSLSAGVREMDPALEGTEPSFYAALFLLGCAIVGCDADDLAKVLEMDSSFAHTMAHRARTSKIWNHETIDPKRWEGDAGGYQFWMDCSVLTGEMLTADGVNYSLSDSGRRRVEKLLGPQDHP